MEDIDIILVVLVIVIIATIVVSVFVVFDESHSVRGIVQEKYLLDYTGDWINHAAVIETTSLTGVIHIDENLYNLLVIGKCYTISESFLSNTYNRAIECEKE